MTLTDKQFRIFCDLIYNECGINLHEGKKQLLNARLAKRLRRTGIASVKEYLKILETDSNELIEFVDAVSTNHTFFFRESHHFENLTEEHRNIWCAASSSGEEPYSIAIYCLEKGFRPTIVGTDIATHVLRQAERAVYPVERAKGTPIDILKKYFQKGHGKMDGYLKVKNHLKSFVTYKRFNLVSDTPPPGQLFDAIFCRNVMIYFDRGVREKVVANLYTALRDGGLFVIGGSESLNGITHQYKYIKPSVYKKIK